MLVGIDRAQHWDTVSAVAQHTPQDQYLCWYPRRSPAMSLNHTMKPLLVGVIGMYCFINDLPVWVCVTKSAMLVVRVVITFVVFLSCVSFIVGVPAPVCFLHTDHSLLMRHVFELLHCLFVDCPCLCSVRRGRRWTTSHTPCAMHCICFARCLRKSL